MTPVFGVAGWKNSGKTTLVARLVTELTGRGLRVSTVKHAHHHFDVDKEGTDSFRHRAAGATEVALVSTRRWAILHELREEAEPPLAEILAKLAPVDLILVEGYKRDTHPKIEVRRRESIRATPLAPEDPTVVAIAADVPLDGERLPVFALDDIGAIAGFVLGFCGLHRGYA